MRFVFVNENGAFKWSPGRVNNRVPGFPAWYNFKYDEDDDAM